eukprot:sb/3471055/
MTSCYLQKKTARSSLPVATKRALDPSRNNRKISIMESHVRYELYGGAISDTPTVRSDGVGGARQGKRLRSRLTQLDLFIHVGCDIMCGGHNLTLYSSFLHLYADATASIGLTLYSFLGACENYGQSIGVTVPLSLQLIPILLVSQNIEACCVGLRKFSALGPGSIELSRVNRLLTLITKVCGYQSKDFDFE